MPSPVLALALLLPSALGLTAVAWATFCRRSEPGMAAFTVLTAMLASVAAALTGTVVLGEAGLLASSGPSVYMPIGYVGFLAGLPWLVFALQYTGHGGHVTRFRLAVASVVGVAHFAFLGAYLWLLPPETMFYTEPSGLEMAVFSASFTTLLVFMATYALGALLLLRTTTSYSHMSTAMGALLALPALAMVPLYTYLPQVALGYGRSHAGVTAGGVLLATTCCFGVVVRADEAFGSTSAAAGPVGRQAILTLHGDAAFTLDDEHRVVECNEVAVETFGLDDEGPLGEPIESVIGESVEALTTEGSVNVRTVDDLWSETTVFLDTADGRRRFDADVTDLTDDRGRRLGLVVYLEDVTERALREQRIGILNRVLRHNLRNKLSIVRGHAEMVPEAEGDLEEYAAAIESAAADLLALGERARDVERVLAAEEDATAPIDVVTESVVDRMRATCQETTFEADIDHQLHVTTTYDALEYALTELCENAAKHNDADDPLVTIRSDREDGWAVLEVADNGPALSRQELVAIRDEAESPLQHGSGLGLWSVRWIVTAFGGEIDVDDNEPRGTVVTLRLPIADELAAGDSVPGELGTDTAGAALEH